ncbi:hypothetical protein K8S19_04180 [bacterium]|nr:hypothetical protein [bacterium]
MVLKKVKCVFAAMILLAGCGQPGVHKPVETPTAIPIMGESIVSRDFLIDGFDEDVASHIFSYFVFRPQAVQTEKKRSFLEKMARAFWFGLVATYPVTRQKQTSIVYWPVQAANRSEMNAASIAEDWEVWISHYHFERAQMVYQRIGSPDTGPFLVSAFEPLASMAGSFRLRTREVLVIDIGLLLPQDYLPCLQQVQTKIFSQPERHVRSWQINAIRDILRPWFQERTETAVFLQTFE